MYIETGQNYLIKLVSASIIDCLVFFNDNNYYQKKNKKKQLKKLKKKLNLSLFTKVFFGKYH